MPSDSPDRSFPDGFLFGVKSSAYQVEGSVTADGRGVSVWDTYSHQPGATHNGDTGDVTADHYRHLEEDLDLLARLGVPLYCFSVAWPRIQPTGSGPANQPGLDFYRRMVDGLLRRGITPSVTLHHWDVPQPLQDRGGWTSRETVGRFADYTAIVARALGTDVGPWMTINEPWCPSWLGYAKGEHAPGHQDLGEAAAANHHLLLAHGEAVRAIRASVPGAQVGISLNLQPFWPASDHEDDLRVARLADGNLNRLFLEPILKGAYPIDMLEHYAGHRPGFAVVQEGDLAVIAEPLDFLGVNYYAPMTVCAVSRMDQARAAGYWVPAAGPTNLLGADTGMVEVLRPAFQHTRMGWEIDPAGLAEVLARVRGECGTLPIYVTENGAACDDYVGPDGEIHDTDRIAYLESHLRVVLDAVRSGNDIRGYFVWSLIDNFEWAQGFQRRFGMVWVDYPSGRRTPKASFDWYRRTVRANALMPIAG
ncbi:MAG: family 1 glycosylhydrolase [Candidatus Dormibacteria bacterium]